MKFCDRLFEAAKPIWDQYHEHPFVTGIGDGTLDIEKFRFYMIQDYMYLLDYAKVAALGVIKADDEKVMGHFAQITQGILNEEISVHKSYMKRLGIKEEDVKETKASSVNLAYTHYMLAVSHGGTIAELVAAILPCAWSYWEIGKKLDENPDARHHEFYGPWVTCYSSDEFAQAAIWLIDYMNELAEGKSEKELARLEEIFLYTSRFEYLFWDMSFNKEMWSFEETRRIEV
ncbi:thiaminase II [Priestia taiwanensis]|uniref:Aminopyrimidine aminohydrolase n=1 Tax=Priestia taiwanensis TaxID=1347902 RepID=A0A917EQS1_9BACI|nr:thiaminase II [Priestia taiwanensis]MBM7363092.1 thiaminase/transcriptional activator TenA [Priestia taiwanensis]GGE67641.1 aminopyrimidine aminohydrolase [Priestia taiwanensis]